MVNNRGMRRGCGCGGCLSKIVVAVIVIFVALYWGYSSLTLEKLGKADEAGIFGFLGEEYEDKTARDLGIEDLTLKQIVDYFRRKIFGEDTDAKAVGKICREQERCEISERELPVNDFIGRSS